MTWAETDARWLKIDKIFLAIMLTLFAASVLQWRGVPVFGDDKPFRPLGSVFISTGMLLQAIASVARRRSHLVFYLLLAVSVVALWLGVTARQ